MCHPEWGRQIRRNRLELDHEVALHDLRLGAGGETSYQQNNGDASLYAPIQLSQCHDAFLPYAPRLTLVGQLRQLQQGEGVAANPPT
jgi:hypothetical protein